MRSAAVAAVFAAVPNALRSASGFPAGGAGGLSGEELSAAPSGGAGGALSGAAVSGVGF